MKWDTIVFIVGPLAFSSLSVGFLGMHLSGDSPIAFKIAAFLGFATASLMPLSIWSATCWVMFYGVNEQELPSAGKIRD